MTEIRQTSAQVTLQCEHAGPIVYNHFPRYTMLLGSVQIVSGVVLLVLGVACVSYGVSAGAHGVYLFLSAILAGAFGVAAGKSKTICKIVTTMIFSILTSIISCIVVVLLGNVLLYGENERHTYMVTFDRYGYYQRESMTSFAHTTLTLVFLAAVVEAAASIAMSSIGSHFSCFCCRNCCCKFDLTTTERVLVRDLAMEQQLQLLGCAARAPAAATDTKVQHAIRSCSQDGEQLLTPSTYCCDV